MSTTALTADQLAKALYDVEHPNPVPAGWDQAGIAWRDHVTDTAKLILLRVDRGVDLEAALAMSWHSRHNPVPETWVETSDAWREVSRAAAARILKHLRDQS